MESRKKRNREIERRRRQQQRVFTWVLAACIAVSVLVLGYAVWDVQNRRTFMTFEGTRIASTDYRYFLALAGEPETEEEKEVFKNNALDSLLLTLAILDRAERHSLKPTDEEMAELIDWATGMRDEAHNYIPGGLNFISANRIAELNSTWGSVNEALLDIYVSDYEPDEEELAEFLEGRRANIESNATEMYFRYIASLDYNELLLAQMAISTGEAAFDDMARAHDMYYTEGEVAEPIELHELIMTLNIGWEYREMLTNMQEGEFSEIMQSEDGIFILALMTEHTVDYEAVEASLEEAREQYINRQRNELLWELIEQWRDEATYSLNKRAFKHF